MTALLQDLWQGLLDPVPEREGHHPAAHAHTATVQLRQGCLKTALRKEQQACSTQEAGDPAQLRDLGIHASLRLGTTPARLETNYHTPLQTFRGGGRTARSNGFDLQRQLDPKDPPLRSNMLESQRKSAGWSPRVNGSRPPADER